jgi:hypothetical protein
MRNTLMIVGLASSLNGCVSMNFNPPVEPQPTVVIVGGQQVLQPPPNVVRDQMREKVKGFLNGCLTTAVAAERRLGRLPRQLEIEGFCAGEAVNNFPWLAGADNWELREIRENFEISLDRINWSK